ncbi:hypothetical protein ACJJTC_009256 [Scirpophaga incertulas]
MVNCGACGKIFVAPITDKTQLAKDWICPNCKRQMRKGDNSQTPVKNLCEDSDLEEPAQLSSSAGPAGASAAAASSAEIAGNGAPCESPSPHFTLRLDGVERRLEVLERGQIARGRRQSSAARAVYLCAQAAAQRPRPDALLSDIEVGHLPEEKGENTVHEVMVLAGRLGVPLEARDVVFAERVGARPAEDAGRVRRVVVRLASRHLRDELLRAARVRRAGLTAGSGFRVYVNERLTGPNRTAFSPSPAKSVRRLHWKYSWTRRGRIFARQGDGRPAFQFREEQDLERYFGPGSGLILSLLLKDSDGHVFRRNTLHVKPSFEKNCYSRNYDLFEDENLNTSPVEERIENNVNLNLERNVSELEQENRDVARPRRKIVPPPYLKNYVCE